MGFQQAIKTTFTLNLLLAGIAGAGKSYTGFQLARELSGGERFAVIDSENGKSRKYADEFQFDVSELSFFSIETYRKEIKEAERMGYRVLVIDGLSQLWEGRGGIKEMVEMIARRDKITTFSAWQQGNIIIADFIKELSDSPLHIICTVRSKTDYSSSENDKGRTQYKRIGLAPIFKDNAEFEFDLYAEMDQEHNMIFQKSLCRKLSRKVLAMEQDGAARQLSQILKKWMTGVPASERQIGSSVLPEPQKDNQVKIVSDADPQAPVTEQQRASLLKLYQHLGKNDLVPESMTYVAAKELIAQLSQEYRASRAQAQPA